MTGPAAYTSTVTARGPALVVAVTTTGFVAGLLIAVGVRSTPLVVALAVVAVAAVPASLHLATVRLGLGPGGVAVGSGVRGRTRWIPLADITEQTAQTIDWRAVYGVGPPTRRHTRLTVRAGPTLRLWLRSGEVLSISTDDAVGACLLLAAWRTETRTA